MTLGDARPPLYRVERSTDGWAEFSADGRYRYALGRCVQRDWTRPEPPGLGAVWVMLNPSTAGAYVDDHTIRKVLGFSERAGLWSVVVLNLYAVIATDPDKLIGRSASDAIGGLFAEAFARHVRRGATLIAAWGGHSAATQARVDVVDALITLAQVAVPRWHCLGTTRDGAPRHPARIPYSQPLIPWNPKDRRP